MAPRSTSSTRSPNIAATSSPVIRTIVLAGGLEVGGELRLAFECGRELLVVLLAHPLEEVEALGLEGRDAGDQRRPEDAIRQERRARERVGTPAGVPGHVAPCARRGDRARPRCRPTMSATARPGWRVEEPYPGRLHPMHAQPSVTSPRG